MLRLTSQKVEKQQKKLSAKNKDEESEKDLKGQGSSLREHITDVHARLEAAYEAVSQFNRQLYALSDDASLAKAGFKNVGNIVVTQGAKLGANVGGTAAGAAIGTAIAPGFGTFIGALGGFLFSQLGSYVTEKIMDEAKLNDPMYPRTSKLDTKKINKASRNFLRNKISEYSPNRKEGLEKDMVALGEWQIGSTIDTIVGSNVPTIDFFPIAKFLYDLNKSTSGLTDEKCKKIIDQSTELEQYIESQFASAAKAFEALSKDKIHLTSVKAALKRVYGGGETTLSEMRKRMEKIINFSTQNREIAALTLDRIKKRKGEGKEDRLLRTRKRRQDKQESEV